MAQETIGNLQQHFDLHNSSEVSLLIGHLRHEGEHIPNNPEATVGHYMGRLASKHALFNRDLPNAELRQQRFIDSHTISTEDIPDAHFERIQRQAAEQGLGHMALTPAVKRMYSNIVISDQADSLKEWVKYLSDPELIYPTWFKYLAYRSVVRLSGFDKRNQRFNTRSKGTVATFPELSPEALSHTFEELINDPSSADIKFSKLYGRKFYDVQNAENQDVNTEGKWILYPQSDTGEGSKILADSLKGYGTTWCTAGHSVAKEQIRGGDFYVYYTYNRKGNPVVPRIAIRMKGEMVREVSGILPSQEIEPVMLNITKDKIADLPGNGRFLKEYADRERLSVIGNTVFDDPTCELTTEDLHFLYDYLEYGNDWRMKDKIIRLRDKYQDATILYPNDPITGFLRLSPTDSEIKELLSGDTVSCDEDLAVRIFNVQGVNGARILAYHLDSFTGLSYSLAAKLVGKGQMYQVANNLESFEKLDINFAEYMIKNGYVDELVCSIDCFTGYSINQLVADIGQRHIYNL